MKICIIGNRLGCDDSYNMFHKSLYRSCKNNIYGNENRKYIDIEYYEYDSSTQEFEERWNSTTDTKKERWEELFNETKGDYAQSSDIHGTYTLASLRRIAPAANYMFVETKGSDTQIRRSVEWLHEYYYDYEFDILVISVTGYNNWGDELEDLADLGVITVNTAGNSDDIFTNEYNADYPCSYDFVVGVTGVIDSSHGSSSERWYRESEANTGYGIEIAAITEASELDWAPFIGVSEFVGTSNACPIVAGIIALVEQYQNNYKSGTDLNVTIIKDLFKETGDGPGDPPSSNTTEIGGYYSFIHENTTYTNFPYHNNAPYETYDLGWGIIDGYEMYKYFKQNY